MERLTIPEKQVWCVVNLFFVVVRLSLFILACPINALSIEPTMNLDCLSSPKCLNFIRSRLTFNLHH